MNHLLKFLDRFAAFVLQENEVLARAQATFNFHNQTFEAFESPAYLRRHAKVRCPVIR